MEEKLRRLAEAGIDVALMPGGAKYVLLARDGFAALVSIDGGALGRVGSSALVTPNGLAMLVWRGQSPFFVGKGTDIPATAEQLELVRGFTKDLESALS